MERIKELAKKLQEDLIQNRQSRDAAFYVGKGKVEEIKAYSDSGTTIVILMMIIETHINRRSNEIKVMDKNYTNS